MRRLLSQYMDIAKARSQLPITNQWIYLNHAGVAPISQLSADAMRAMIKDVEENGIAHIDTWNRLYEQARISGANLLGCDPRQIAFQKNTTEGIIAAANGIRWSNGDNIVIARGEFPANAYPWLNQQPKGVDIH